MSHKCTHLNPKDTNAILICVSVGCEDLPLGYVPGPQKAQIKRWLASDSVTQTNIVFTREFIPVVDENISVQGTIFIVKILKILT